MGRKIVIAAGALAVFAGLAEVFGGYVSWQRENPGLAISRLFRGAQERFAKGHSESAPQVFVETSGRNPFSGFPWSAGSLALHPFIDYTNAYSKVGAFKVDYFGFRNESNLYFGSQDSRLIVLTGGSEAAGYTHRTTVAQHLERRLGPRYKVLNLAMCGYSLANEINAYVHLAHHLKPAVVISYSGYNDLFYGLMGPSKFKELGLNYNKTLELFLHQYHNPGLARTVTAPPWILNERGSELIVDGYLRNVDKYKSIVEANGGKFVGVVQGYPKGYRDGTERDKVYSRVHALYDELLPKAKKRGLVLVQDDPRLKYVDSVHSTEESSAALAEIFLGALSLTGNQAD